VFVIGDILQPTHLLFVLVIALLVLGPKRLPEVGRSLGKGIRDFRSAIGGEEQESPTAVPSHVSSESSVSPGTNVSPGANVSPGTNVSAGTNVSSESTPPAPEPAEHST
jgi:sec-independent protein translocase protein TatA